MNYAQIKWLDTANGPGIRVSIFVSGCNHHCKGCFNQETWDFKYGEQFTNNTADAVIDALSNKHIAGLSLLGGEPLEYENQQALLPLLRRVKQQYPDKTVWLYTGYKFDSEVMAEMFQKWEDTKELFAYIDIVVDGRYLEEKKDLSLRFRGSSNQRIIQIKETLQSGSVKLWND